MVRLILLSAALTGALAALVTVISAVGASSAPGVFALDGFDCAPPCWQGIVPGETRARRAQQLLGASRFVAQGSVRYNLASIDYEDTGTLYWSALTARDGAPKGATAQVEGWVVTALDLPGLDARLGDVVAELGPPTWVLARYMPAEGAMRLVVDVLYTDLGIRLSVSGAGYRHLSPALTVNRAYYGGRMSAPRLGNLVVLPEEMEWKGFVSLARYGVTQP